MKWLCLTLVAAAALIGCGKKSTAPAAGASTPPDAASATDQKPLDGTVDATLTTALKSFVKEKGRLPQNMLELRTTKIDSVPRAPAGFMYAIDPVTVEVKLVKQ